MSTNRKSAKRTIVDPEGQPVHVEPEPRSFGFDLPIPPASVVVDVARMGVQLGIGLAAMALDAAQKVAVEAIDRGAKLEKQGIESLKAIEREQVTYMKEYLSRAKGRAVHEVSLEARVEEALRTFDVPTRDDIRELNQKLTALDGKISSLSAK